MRTILGLMHLLALLVRSRFRLRGPYWSWRRATALGSERPTRRQAARAVLEYARWVERMRRLSR